MTLNEAREWVKAHKCELIIAGMSFAAIIAAIYVAKNRKEVLKLLNKLKNSLKEPAKASVESAIQKSGSVMETVEDAEEFICSCSKELREQIPHPTCGPFSVEGHLLYIPGKNPSPEKLEYMRKVLGIEPPPHYTWRDSYTKCAA